MHFEIDCFCLLLHVQVKQATDVMCCAHGVVYPRPTSTTTACTYGSMYTQMNTLSCLHQVHIKGKFH